MKGQVVVEYVILFAITLTAMLAASRFFDNVKARMSQTRDIGIQLIMGR